MEKKAAVKDPIQKKLRDHKKEWNKNVSVLIDDVIHFKWLINGKPNKWIPQGNKITEPVPGYPNSLLNEILSDFERVATESQKIVAEQAEYVKNREVRKNQNAQNPHPGTNLNKIFSAQDYDLEALGSNPLSRFITKLRSPHLGNTETDIENRFKILLINSATKLSKETLKIQSAIIGSSDESIFISMNLLEVFLKKLNSLINQFNEYASRVQPSKQDKIEEVGDLFAVKEIKALQEATRKAILDFKKNESKLSSEDMDLPSFLNFKDFLLKISLAKPNDRLDFIKDFIISYNKFVKDLSEKYKTKASSLEELFASISANLEAKGNALKRFFGQLSHHLSLFDETSYSRLSVFNNLTVIRDSLNSILDSLEEGVDIDFLNSEFKDIVNKFSEVASSMNNLNSMLKGTKHHQKYIEMLKNKSLTDFDVPLSENEIDRLTKMLDSSRIRDLTNLYKNKMK